MHLEPEAPEPRSAVEPEPAPRNAAARLFLAAGESLIAVIVAMGATLVLTVPVFAVFFFFGDGAQALREESYETDFGLTTSSEESTEDLDELVGRIQELDGVAAVDVSESDGGEMGLTLLTTAPFHHLRGEVEAILEQSGYRPGVSTSRNVPGLMAWMRDASVMRRILPPAMTVQALVFVACGALLIRYRLRREPAAPTPAPLVVLGWGVAGGAVAFGASIGTSLLLSWLGLPIQEQDWLTDLLQDRSALLLLSPWIVLLVPFAEEVFFRGYVFRFVGQRSGWTAGLIVSALLFALVHFNPSGTPVYVLVGLIFAGVYTRTRSLVTPVVAHMVYNGLVLLPALIVASG